MKAYALCLLLLVVSACAATQPALAVNEFCVKTGRVPATLAELVAASGSDEDVTYVLALIENRRKVCGD